MLLSIQQQFFVTLNCEGSQHIVAVFEDNTHVFIFRIWLERRELPETAPEWRGMIEHLPSGQRRYVKKLPEVTAFVALYLEKEGVALNPYERVQQWLKRKKLR